MWSVIPVPHAITRDPLAFSTRPFRMPSPASLPAPSADVRSEARARAERLVTGLFSHQVEGVAFLLGRRRAILADDMGLGKTRQSITALREAAPEGRGRWCVRRR